MDDQVLIQLLKDTPAATFTVKVLGRSMLPFLKEGDKVRFRKVPLSKVSAGSLIVFRDGEYIFSHRLIQKIKGKEKYFFLEKGDNTLSFSLRTEDDYLGQIDRIESKGKIKKIDCFPQNFLNKIFLFWSFLIITLIKLKRNIAFNR